MPSRISAHCAAAIAVFAAVFAQSAAAQEDFLRELEEAERAEKIAQHQARMIPGAMSPQRLNTWVDAFSLNDDQQELFEALRAEYARRMESIDRSYGREVAELWPAAFEYDREMRQVEPVHTPLLLDLYDEHLRLLDRTLDADRWLFNSLRAQLQPEQVYELRREQVARLKSMLQLEPALREINLELSEIVDEFGLTDQERVVVRPRVMTHLNDRAEAMAELVMHKRRDIDLARARYLTTLGPHWELAAAPEAAARIARDLHRIDDVERVMWLRTAQQNWNDLKAIAERLSEQRSRELRELYLRRIWPDIFEEEDALLAFAESMREWLPDPETDQAVDSILNDQRDRLRVELQRHFESALETRFTRGVDELHPLDFAALSRELHHLEHLTPLERLFAEASWLEFRRQRRDHLMSFAAALQTLYQVHRPDDLEPIRRYRESLERRQDADGYRINALRARAQEIVDAQRAAEESSIEGS